MFVVAALCVTDGMTGDAIGATMSPSCNLHRVCSDILGNLLRGAGAALQEREEAERVFGGDGTGQTTEQAAAKTFEPGEGLPEAAGASNQGESCKSLLKRLTAPLPLPPSLGLNSSQKCSRQGLVNALNGEAEQAQNPRYSLWSGA